ncbi:MAG: hypothetical protein J1F02_07720 [Lachnospiraceae bacterium]|nr:hypothetical protein [Lachnospiraceae bacterium]
MKHKYISDAIGNISTRHIEEAENYMPAKKAIFWKHPLGILITAAVLALCFIAGGIYIFSPSDDMIVMAYNYETNEDIPATGVTISTGKINDDGEMRGHPLMFYLSGRKIEKVRFSCKNQKMDFRDWTEKRDEYGEAQNFTVDYGKDESEYYYLTIDWMPNDIIEELTDHADSTIAVLPMSMREDIIVMEISFFNGKTTTKAITITLQEDGTFFAAFDDYKIGDTDDFVKRPDSTTPITKRSDSTPIPHETPYEQGEKASKDKNKEKAAKEAARDYYSHTIFELVSLEVKSQSENEIEYWARVKKEGVLQEPDRHIRLRFKGGKWKVVGEGY